MTNFFGSKVNTNFKSSIYDLLLVKGFQCGRLCRSRTSGSHVASVWTVQENIFAAKMSQSRTACRKSHVCKHRLRLEIHTTILALRLVTGDFCCSLGVCDTLSDFSVKSGNWRTGSHPSELLVTRYSWFLLINGNVFINVVLRSHWSLIATPDTHKNF